MPCRASAEIATSGKNPGGRAGGREKDKQATFTGDVHVLQATPRCVASCSPLQGERDAQRQGGEPGPGGDKQIRRIEPKQRVVVQKESKAAGMQAIFNMRGEHPSRSPATSWSRARGHPAGPAAVVDLTTGVSKMDQAGWRIVSIRSRNTPPDARNAPERNDASLDGGLPPRGVPPADQVGARPARRTA